LAQHHLENRVQSPDAAAAAGVLSVAVATPADRALDIPLRESHMANETFTAIQTTVATPGFDADADGVIDPGEQVTTTVTITNNSTTAVAATDVQFTETLDGMTIVNQPGDDINVSPIAFDDAYNVVGNTTFVVSAADGILNGSTPIHVTLSADAEFFTNTIGANAATQTHIMTTGVITPPAAP
jgi:uncharacterized repeat protein (TIGR01451 family)